MNTVKVGDKFESKSYDLIENAIKNGELGILENSAKVYKKKGYYSKDREKEIIFDLSIEIWPQGATRYTLLYLIECKSSPSGNYVPVDDVEEFYTKINQVAGGGVKGIMISDNKFQTGGITFAKNKNMMLIEVDKEDNHTIILHRTERTKDKAQKNNDQIVFNFLKKTLGLKRIKGLKKLSAIQIDNMALSVLRDYNDLKSPIEIHSFVNYLENKYKLTFDFSKNLENLNGKKIKGYFDIENNSILIDESIVSTEQFPFVLGHEVGHFFLHSKLKVNQEQYNDFEDSKYDFFSEKHLFTNEKNWIEWQANKFAVALFLPKDLFCIYSVTFRKSIGINRNPQFIYLDEQPINQKDYRRTVDFLSNHFSISKTAIRYRMEELNLIITPKPKIEPKPKVDLRDLIRQALSR